VEAEHRVQVDLVRASVSPPRVAVIGLGNVLMGDDAFGPWVVQTLLAEYRFAEGVTVEDLGTPGLDLMPWVTDLEALILVDTVRADATPGTLRLYRRDDVLKHPPPSRLSPHDPALKEALLTAEFAGRGPREVLLVGAVPETTAMGVRLSTALRAAVPAAAEEVLKELERLGRPATRRCNPPSPDTWWARAPDVDPAARGGEEAPGASEDSRS
jgi:hydrogenase maturation protease